MKSLRILLLLLTAILVLTATPLILLADTVEQVEPVDVVAQPIDPLLDDPSIPPMEGGEPYPFPIIYYEPPAGDEVDAPDVPTINVWYGTTQNFGQIGNPQRWVNILGSVQGATSLAYSLNGGAFKPATIGSIDSANPPRLSAAGDFNIELPIADLNDGANTLIIRAADAATNVTQNVTVNYNPNSVWPLPTTVNWNNYASVLQAAQPVDGLWTISGDKLETVIPGYDRLVAIGQGNMNGNGWTDYVVEVPVTVHSLTGPGGTQPPAQSSGVGLIVRWSGHIPTSSDPAGGPTLGWRQIGALAWYRWASSTKAAFEIRGNGGQDITPPKSDKAIEFGVEYIFKLSVQSAAFTGNSATYRFKFWPAGEPEPPQWYMTATGASGEPAAGSAVLVAHNAMVSFGKVEVKPITTNQAFNIDVQQPANGNIIVSPPADGVAYRYGETVEIRSQGQGNYVMANWTGDFSGNQNPLVFDITDNLTVGAVFEIGSKPKLTVTTSGQGSVEISPKRTNDVYTYGEVVTLTPKPNLGYIFSGWSGDLSGADNPAEIVMDKAKTITANFITANPNSPISDDFNACALNTNLWTFVNPVGDGSYQINGTQLRLNVPAGVSHNIWDNGNRSVRVMQPTQNADFEVVAKFESVVSERFQMQGILVEGDAQNFLRFEVHFDGTNNRLYVASFVDGKPKAIINSVYLPTTPPYLRVTRVGSLWSFSSSGDGQTWQSAGSFSHALTVTKSGVFAANHGATGASIPAHTAIVDYFFNTAKPIQPEDGNNLGNLTVTINKVGQGTVNLSPAKPTYGCGEKVTLTAVPANGWMFAGWSGDLTGTSSSQQVTVSRNLNITATFVTFTGAKVYMPMVIDN